MIDRDQIYFNLSISAVRSSTSEKFHKMLAVYEACKAAGIEQPECVWSYFNNVPPKKEGNGVEIPLQDDPDSHESPFQIINGIRKDYNSRYTNFAINLHNLPEDVDQIIVSADFVERRSIIPGKEQT